PLQGIVPQVSRGRHRMEISGYLVVLQRMINEMTYGDIPVIVQGQVAGQKVSPTLLKHPTAYLLDHGKRP
ncbi:MAG TPA: hypothetical protein VKH37_06945, partial [Ferruginibacter sp.]|nr:hypothetical protein [Ferruginibacter sp.]